MNIENQNVEGVVEFLIQHKNGTIERYIKKNTILRKGKEALAAVLANSSISLSNGEPSDRNSFNITRMVFGSGGTVNNTPKTVADSRTSLFGTTVISKPVIAAVDPNVRTEVILTSVATYSDGNGFTINEMALEMANGELYSMVTFPDLTKTAQIQITWNWRINFI